MILVKYDNIMSKTVTNIILIYIILFINTIRLEKYIQLELIYMIVYILLLLLLYLNKDQLIKNSYILLLFIPFIIWTLFSAIWSIEIYKTLIYVILYVILILSAHVISNIFINNIRIFLLLLLYLNITVLAMSGFSLISNVPSDAWTANHGLGFTGFFTHQNTLAAILLFSSLGVVTIKYKLKAIIIILNIILITITYSRSVVLSVILGLLILLFSNKKILLRYKYHLAALFLIATIYTIYNFNYIENILKKNQSSYFSTRTILWVPSFEASKNNLLLGVGLGNSDQAIITNYVDYDLFCNIKREKGSSTFAVIEETGMIGLIFFLIPYIYLIYKKKENTNNSLNRVFLLYILLLFFHSQFEAWLINITSRYILLYLIIIIITIKNFESNNQYKKLYKS